MAHKKMAICKNPFASKRSKVRPLWLDTAATTATTATTTTTATSAAADGILLLRNININTSSPRGGIEYLQARRAFLSSYQFSYYDDHQQQHFHYYYYDKIVSSLKRFAEGISKLAAAGKVFVLEKKIIKRFQIRVRVYRLNLAWPNGVFVRCFLPLPCKSP